jgi:poly-gamma-glutamate system protein
MIQAKLDLLVKFKPELLINIGGSQANLGNDEAVISLPPGLIKGGSLKKGGNGVLGQALKQGLPVIHFLNLKRLSQTEGIPFDSRPRRQGPAKIGLSFAGLGVLLYIVVLLGIRRWQEV